MGTWVTAQKTLHNSSKGNTLLYKRGDSKNGTPKVLLSRRGFIFDNSRPSARPTVEGFRVILIPNELSKKINAQRCDRTKKSANEHTDPRHCCFLVFGTKICGSVTRTCSAKTPTIVAIATNAKRPTTSLEGRMGDVEEWRGGGWVQSPDWSPVRPAGYTRNRGGFIDGGQRWRGGPGGDKQVRSKIPFRNDSSLFLFFFFFFFLIFFFFFFFFFFLISSSPRNRWPILFAQGLDPPHRETTHWSPPISAVSSAIDRPTHTLTHSHTHTHTQRLKNNPPPPLLSLESTIEAIRAIALGR